MKRPDRFARRAKKELAAPWVLNEARLAMLFRAEHRAVVRIVQQLRLRARNAAFASVRANTCPEWDAAKIEVLNDLLDALAARSK